MTINTKSCTVLREKELNHHRWPLTIMWLAGKEKEVDHTSFMMQYGVIPWRIDVHTRLEAVKGPLPYLQLPLPYIKTPPADMPVKGIDL